MKELFTLSISKLIYAMPRTLPASSFIPPIRSKEFLPVVNDFFMILSNSKS